MDKVWSGFIDRYVAGLFKPQKATSRRSKDYSAIARMNKKVFDTLGVARVRDRSPTGSKLGCGSQGREPGAH